MADQRSTYKCKHCGSDVPIPQHEIRSAMERLQMMEAISKSCDWGIHDSKCTAEARRARERYFRLEKVQTEFENKYM